MSVSEIRQQWYDSVNKKIEKYLFEQIRNIESGATTEEEKIWQK